jgi:hypothetical protein
MSVKKCVRGHVLVPVTSSIHVCQCGLQDGHHRVLRGLYGDVMRLVETSGGLEQMQADLVEADEAAKEERRLDRRSLADRANATWREWADIPHA